MSGGSMDYPRIVGGHSIHAEEKPELCHSDSQCGNWRCVSCCEFAPDVDIIECSRCGKQRKTRCNFDEEYS